MCILGYQVYDKLAGFHKNKILGFEWIIKKFVLIGLLTKRVKFLKSFEL